MLGLDFSISPHSFYQVNTPQAEEVLPAWQAEGIHFDAAVVAPPRKGLEPEFVKTLIELAPDKIV